ncbi:MAG: response regulator transcription factor [Paracoccaceae bacterium]|nr:response regulator transcription factor [Paracoccaceae bacterium]
MTQVSEVSSTSIDVAAEGWALIVDDHPMFCDALELTLRSISEFDTIRNANSIGEAVALLSEKTAPALVVLDLNLPDANGLDGLTRIVNLVSPAPVIVVSSLTDNRIVTSALKVGASGYVPKHSPRTVFKAAVESVEQGRIYVPDNFVPTEVPTRQSEALRALSSLTPQQARILEFMSDGLLNKQIAYELSIAEATVKAHVTAIMRKLGVQNRTQAVLVAKDATFDSILPEDKI